MGILVSFAFLQKYQCGHPLSDLKCRAWNSAAFKYESYILVELISDAKGLQLYLLIIMLRILLKSCLLEREGIELEPKEEGLSRLAGRAIFFKSVC